MWLGACNFTSPPHPHPPHPCVHLKWQPFSVFINFLVYVKCILSYLKVFGNKTDLIVRTKTKLLSRIRWTCTTWSGTWPSAGASSTRRFTRKGRESAETWRTSRNEFAEFWIGRNEITCPEKRISTERRWQLSGWNLIEMKYLMGEEQFPVFFLEELLKN